MNGISVLSKSDKFHDAFILSVHKYLDERESLLWEDSDFDVEVFREVSALYRVVKNLADDASLKPMPDLIKRMFYLKRDIYHTHRPRFEKKKYSSRYYIRKI